MRIFLVLIMLLLVTANVSLSQAHLTTHESCISLCPVECEFESCDLIIESPVEIHQFEKQIQIISYFVLPSAPALYAPKRPPKTNA